MAKTICLYFEIHHPMNLKRYRFFDIGRDHFYYDDFENERNVLDYAERSYIPALTTLIEMAKEHKKFFKCAFSFSGVGLEQLEIRAPQVIDMIQELNKTGCVEFLCEPYSHGLSSLINEECFREECLRMKKKIQEVFGQTPKVLRNSSLIYSNDIGLQAAEMGFKGIMTEGAKHVLGWKSPHFVYHCELNPNLKLLLRDYKLSDDISLRFSNPSWENYPLFADTWMDWIANLPENEEVVNIFMELCALGVYQPLSSNILDFMKALPSIAKHKDITFSWPSELCKRKSAGGLDVPYNISWVGEERDTSSWLGNTLQREAFQKLYSVADRIRICNDKRLKQDWDYLQASKNFRYMSTKAEGIALKRGIYDGPYDAFTNYMNILADFFNRINTLYPVDMDNDELNSLLTVIKNQDEEIKAKDKKIEKLQKELDGKPVKAPKSKETKTDSKKTATKKAAVKKTAVKKTATKKTVTKPAAKKATARKPQSKKSTRS